MRVLYKRAEFGFMTNNKVTSSLDEKYNQIIAAIKLELSQRDPTEIVSLSFDNRTAVGISMLDLFSLHLLYTSSLRTFNTHILCLLLCF